MKKNEPIKNQEIAALEAQVVELTSGWQRTQADFQNYRRQTEEDRKKFNKMVKIDFLTEIFPVLDNFQLAATHVPTELESNNWVIGVKQIEKQLETILADSGLKRIASVGTEFNPLFHESVESVKCDKPEGEIVDEVQSGYTFDDAVIRPARVKVSSGK